MADVVRRMVWRIVDALHPSRSYYPARRTIAAARRAGVSVPDYVEGLSDAVGQTDLVIERLQTLGVLRRSDRICEIGAGAGRYLDRIVRLCAPTRYDVYEIDSGWARYLARTYGPAVAACDTDGETLAETPAASCGLVMALGVFIASRPLQTFSYIREMVRVVQPGGFIVFDFYPAEEVTLDGIFGRWLPSIHRFAVWLPEGLVRKLLADGDCEVIHRSTLDFVWSRPVLVVARRREGAE